ncbi:hypothetical protein [uncultured Ramlibacter sp.]|uniref:hypothetical protein n=1 Tax=uncultured Ramlibacter sp. TaxID=260755 RepID=UPI00260F927B|nr:hypothetical protein [uncultured Ramlibacter sp.]
MNAPKKPAPKATDFGGLYLPGDRIPSVDAVEADTESAWALFTALSSGDGEPRGFEQTAPNGLPTRPVAEPGYAATEPAGLQMAARHKPPSGLTPEAVMLEARRNNRVCPQQLQWQLLYDLLPVKADAKGRQDPLPPPAGQAWKSMPALSKRTCLRLQIEWAAANGCLQTIHNFFGQLQEDDWHHIGD